jgi:rRNA-processing protein FCF1
MKINPPSEFKKTNPNKPNFCIGSMVHRLELQDWARKADTLIRRP